MRIKLFSTLTILAFFFGCVKKRDLSINQVIVQISYSPDGLHPTNGNSSVKSFIENYTQKTLLYTDLQTEELKHLLAKPISNSDSSGTLFSYELNSSVFWDNQEKLSAADIIFSTKIVLCPLTNNNEIRPVYSTVIDSVFQDLANPNIFHLRTKTKHVLNKEIIGGIIIQQESHWDPEHLLRTLSFKQIHNKEFESSPKLDKWFNQFNSSDNAYIPEKICGLGPYQVISFEKDNYITLQRKQNWWGDEFSGQEFDNFPEKITFKIIQDNSAITLGIKSQEIDFTTNTGGISKLMQLQKLDYFNEQYNSDFVPGYAYNYLGFNTKPSGSGQLPFFVDKNVRRAIAHLIPVQEIIDVIYYGKAQRQASIVSPLKSSCDTTLSFIDFDVDKAKKLLQEAGWIDTDDDQILDKEIDGKRIPFSFKLNYIMSGSAQDIVFMMKESCKMAGIELIPNPLDFNSHYQKAGNHDFDAMLGGWLAGAGYSDPNQLWSTESWMTKGSNFTGFGNAYSDSLILLANTSLDPTEHLKYYRKLQKLIYEEQPYVFLWSAEQPMAAHKRFENTSFYRARPNICLGSFQLKTPSN